jgi:hypothetical protein
MKFKVHRRREFMQILGSMVTTPQAFNDELVLRCPWRIYHIESNDGILPLGEVCPPWHPQLSRSVG